MALTPEQQAQVDLQTAIAQAQLNANSVETDRSRKLQCLQIAHTIILENRRNLPVEHRQIAAEEVTEFADTLIGYVNA